MSKVALCLSGQPRFIQENFDGIYDHIIKPSGCDVFCHFWDTVDGSKGMCPNKAIEMYNPLAYAVDEQISFEGNDRLFRMQSLFYSVQKCNNLRTQFEEVTKTQYDCVIRTRTDKVFDLDFSIGEFESAPEALWVHNEGYFACGRTYSDAFAFGSSEIINKYSNCYDHLQVLIPKLEKNHPGHQIASECYLTHYLEKIMEISDIRVTQMRRILEPHYIRSK